MVQQKVNFTKKDTVAKAKNKQFTGEKINVGDLVFGANEVGYVRKKVITEQGYVFEIKILSRKEHSLMQLTAAEFVRTIEQGTWNYYPVL